MAIRQPETHLRLQGLREFRGKNSPYWSERFLRNRIKNVFKNFKKEFRKVNDENVKAASKKFNEDHRRKERTVGVSSELVSPTFAVLIE